MFVTAGIGSNMSPARERAAKKGQIEKVDSARTGEDTLPNTRTHAEDLMETEH